MAPVDVCCWRMCVRQNLHSPLAFKITPSRHQPPTILRPLANVLIIPLSNISLWVRLWRKDGRSKNLVYACLVFNLVVLLLLVVTAHINVISTSAHILNNSNTPVPKIFRMTNQIYSIDLYLYTCALSKQQFLWLNILSPQTTTCLLRIFVIIIIGIFIIIIYCPQ